MLKGCAMNWYATPHATTPARQEATRPNCNHREAAHADAGCNHWSPGTCDAPPRKCSCFASRAALRTVRLSRNWRLAFTE
jgi:hypothetical protein